MCSRCWTPRRSVKLLVTGRVRLRVRGEHVLRLSPLPVPRKNVNAIRHRPVTGPICYAAYRPCPRTRSEPIRANASNAEPIASRCRQLDGLPLVIELAGVRTDSPESPPREQSLRATLEWSHASLSEPEQLLFRPWQCLLVAGPMTRHGESQRTQI
jgi:predicted ATPase